MKTKTNINLANTWKAIKSEFPGTGNKGLRDEIFNLCVADAENYDSENDYDFDLTVLTRRIVFSNTELAKNQLKAIQDVYTKDLEAHLN